MRLQLERIKPLPILAPRFVGMRRTPPNANEIAHTFQLGFETTSDTLIEYTADPAII